MSHFTISIIYNGHRLAVMGSASKIIQARAYLKNGDPGYPEEGGIEEIEKIFIWRGMKERRLPEAMQTKLSDDSSFLECVFEALNERGI